MIQINPTSNQPIFEQIISQIKTDVLKGYLKPGDALPSVRKLALQLSVTPGTVAKAYSELEHQEVIVTIRGKGAYIAEKSKVRPSESQLERGFACFHEACMELIYMGVSQSEMVAEVQKIYTSVGQ
nr:GntR family transcriptional regulator [Eubacterium sp.]